jgi:hypothetical protein
MHSPSLVRCFGPSAPIVVFLSSSVVSHASFLLLMGSTIFFIVGGFSALVVALGWKTVPNGFFDCAFVARWFLLQWFHGFF